FSDNINPTQYSLNSVNWAYTAYSIAVNRYNSLVDLYNVTPALTSREVYLPYTFREGDVRFGWRASIRADIAGHETVECVKESIAKDFVRRGCKYTDRTEQYRKDDLLDIDVRPAAAIAHLSDVVMQVKEAMGGALARLATAPVADLGVEETATLGWIFHPWG